MTIVTDIESLDDPRVEIYRNVRDRDLVGREQLFMAESEIVIRRLLRTPHRLHSLFLSPRKLECLRDDLNDLPESIPVYVGEVELISAVAGFHVHRGALAAGIRLNPEELQIDVVFNHLIQQPRVRLVVAEGLNNVDNMGGLFRNVAAFGLDGVLLDPTCCDPLYRKAIRVSMGHVLSVPYAVSRDWSNDLDRLRSEWNMTLIGAEITAEAVPVWDMPRVDRLAIIFGSEEKGLSQAVLERCDCISAIPMSAGTTSLNIAVASAVFFNELATPSEYRKGL